MNYYRMTRVDDLTFEYRIKNRREFVYFITYENGPIKIGKGRNIQSRIKSIQTSVPYKIELLGVMAGGFGLESALHQRFKEFRLNGEWFKKEECILKFIDSHTCDPQFRFFKNNTPDLNDKILILEDRLKNKRAQVEESVRDAVAKTLTDEHTELITNGIFKTLRLIRKIEEMRLEIEKLGIWGGGLEEFRLDVRRSVDELLKTDWQTSLGHLQDDDGLDKSEIMRRTRAWLERAVIQEIDYYIKNKYGDNDEG